jgi:hypothetical protein
VPPAPFHTLHPVGDGVYAWLQPGGESGVSNAGVVVDDDGLTVIDAGLTISIGWDHVSHVG